MTATEPPIPPEPGSPVEAVASPPRRVSVGRIGLVFACVALCALAMMVLLQPG